MIVFLSCVKSKRDETCRADEMYISPLFKYSYNYAKSLNPDHIYILSALYGLLEVDDIIFPYNKTLKEMKKKEREEWGRKVKEKLKEKGVDPFEKVVFCCGDVYRKNVMDYFKGEIEIPVDGLPMGKSLSFYKNLGKVKGSN